MFEAFTGIIFDMDGTLVDSGQLHEVAWIQTLDHYGIPVDRSLMRGLAGVPSQATVDKLRDHFSVETQFSSTEISLYKETLVQNMACDYVKPTALQEQARRFVGVKPMSVGTGAGTQEAENILRWCGLRDMIGPVVGADQVLNPKPAPDTFLRCAELMGVAPEECVVLEDSALGFQAAKQAGMVVIDVLETFGIRNDYFL